MIRLIRGLVVESLGIGGLLWLAMQYVGVEAEPAQSASPAVPSVAVSAPAYGSETVTLRKPVVAVADDAAPAASAPTFFRGTNSLLSNRFD